MSETKLFYSKLINVFKQLAIDPRLNFFDRDRVVISTFNSKKLLEISTDEIKTTGVPINDNFFTKTSPLDDDFVNNSEIKKFISTLSKKESILRLNHVGFCYVVDLAKEERLRLLKTTQQRGLSLYSEESTDGSMWLYAGDISKWNNPLVEFVLVENTDDKWQDYWLPHFQIDIDTNLVAEDIEPLVTEIFDGKVEPFRMLVVNDYVCIIRLRLGIIDGINIDLDIGTEGRMPRFHREKLLSEVV